MKKYGVMNKWFVGIHNYLSQDGQKGIDVSFAYMVEEICHMPQNHSLQ